MSEPTTRDVIATLWELAGDLACPGQREKWGAVIAAINKLGPVAEAEERERPDVVEVRVAGEPPYDLPPVIVYVETQEPVHERERPEQPEAMGVTRAEFDELKRRVDACERGK